MADKLLSDADVVQPAGKLLSDADIAAPPAAAPEVPKPDYDPTDPVNQALFQRSTAGKILNTVQQGNAFTRPFIAAGEAIKGQFQEPLGLSDETQQKLADAGILQDYKSNYFNMRTTLTSAVLEPAARAADLAMRSVGAVVGGVASLVGGGINEITGQKASPEEVANNSVEFVNMLAVATSVAADGMPISPLRAPTLREVMTKPEVVAPEIREVEGAAAAKPEPAQPILKAPVKSKAIDPASGNLNLDYVNVAGDARELLANTAQAYADDSGVVISNNVSIEQAQKFLDEGLREAADGIPEALANYNRGDPTDVAMSLASRRLAIQAAKDAVKATRDVVAGGGNAEINAAYAADDLLMKMNGVRHEISATAGRVLQSHQITIGEEDAAWEAAGKKIAEMGLTQDERLRIYSTLDTPEALAAFVRDVKKPTWGDIAIFHVINNYLSGPLTHTAYAISGQVQTLIRTGLETPVAAAVGAMQRAFGGVLKPEEIRALRLERDALEQKIAEADAGAKKLKASESQAIQKRMKEINTKLNNGTTVMPAEIVGRLYGAGQGQIEGIRAAGRALRTNTMQMLPGEEAAAKQAFKDAVEKASADGKSAEEAQKAGEAAYNKSVIQIKNPILERASFIKNPLMKAIAEGYGRIVGVPTRVASAIHTFQKFSGYTESLNALAYRQAASEGLSGEDLVARVAQLKSNPPAAFIKQAAEEGKYASLVEKPGLTGQAIENLAHVNGWTRFIMPFSRIATNLTSQTLLERSPLGLVAAGVNKAFGAETELYKSLSGAKGAAEQANAIAKMTVGSSIVAAGAWLGAQDIAHGIAPDQANAMGHSYLEGRPPNTVRIGDHNYPLRLFGIPGRIISLGVVLQQAHDAFHNEDLEAASYQTIHGVAQTILRENALTGLADFLDAVNSHEPETAKRYAINAVAAATVPYSVGMNQVTRILDPYMRSTLSDSFLNRLQKTIDSRVPWESSSLYPQVDIYGRDMTRDYNYATAMQDPVTQAEIKLNQFPGKIQPRIQHVKLTDAEYYEYSKTAGASYYAAAHDLVTSSYWLTLDTQTQAEMLHQARRDAVTAASQSLLMNNAPLAKRVSDYYEKLMEKRTQE